MTIRIMQMHAYTHHIMIYIYIGVESSYFMSKRLTNMGFHATHTDLTLDINPVPEPTSLEARERGEGYDLIVLFNLLDRCNKPLSLLVL